MDPAGLTHGWEEYDGFAEMFEVPTRYLQEAARFRIGVIHVAL